MEEVLTIQEVAARTGLSVHALRYYELEGLLNPIDRATSGHRRYKADDLSWLAFLLRLRATGMSIQHMRTYIDLRRRGDATACERLTLLESHQQQVRKHIRELESHLTVIEKKMSFLGKNNVPARRRTTMAKAYYSTIFEQTADQVWAAIRDFGNYTWAENVSESYIEEGKSGDTVGAIRSARINNTDVYHRQRLLAHSDLDRFYTYEFCEPFPYPVRNCVVTLRVTPITDGNRAFVEWSGTFDCEASEYDHWTTYFPHEVWAKLLGSLKRSFSRA